MRDNGKENGNYRDDWGYIGIMEKKMETTMIFFAEMWWPTNVEARSLAMHII